MVGQSCLAPVGYRQRMLWRDGLPSRTQVQHAACIAVQGGLYSSINPEALTDGDPGETEVQLPNSSGGFD